MRDFPDSPAFKTASNAGVKGSISGQGAKTPLGKNEKKKKKKIGKMKKPAHKQ